VEYLTAPLSDPYMAQAKAIRDKSKCAKQKVGCIIVNIDGDVIGIGNNDTLYECPTCPRDDAGCVSGEGYNMCIDVCCQPFHAEAAALVYMGSLKAKVVGDIKNVGARAYLYGHHYCCEPCRMELAKAGITEVYILDGADKALDWSVL
jgi:deoxycytidylate deaminase